MNTSKYFKLTLQYVGTHYHGFQIQDNVPTIQGELSRVVNQMFYQKINIGSEQKVIGSGRTDAGVHAMGQVVRIEIPSNISIDEEGVIRGMNSLLPHDIRVIDAINSTEHFHPIFSAIDKEYQYYFTTTPKMIDPFSRPYVGLASEKLNIEKIKSAAALFVGEHDFSAFQCVGTEVSSTMRKITQSELVRVENFLTIGTQPHIYLYKVVGNGFLKQMVRLIVGALWNIGLGKISESEIKMALKGQFSQRLGPTAPPEGLFLKNVNYKI